MPSKLFFPLELHFRILSLAGQILNGLLLVLDSNIPSLKSAYDFGFRFCLPVGVLITLYLLGLLRKRYVFIVRYSIISFEMKSVAFTARLHRCQHIKGLHWARGPYPARPAEGFRLF